MFESGWDAGLDDAQLSAVVHGDAPLVVLAGAGTGKTRTLTARVASLLDRGVPAERVLLLTFTRRAADEMVARAAAMCTRPEAGQRLQGGTFHAVAHGIVSRHTEALGLPAAVSVLDRADATDVMDLLRHDHGLDGTDRRFPRAATLVDIYSRAVNTGTPARTLIKAEFGWVQPHADAVMDLFRAYVTRKRDRGLLDFDDLLLAWRSLLADPVVGPQIAGRWDHVLVDEYQDVNATQVDIVRALRPDGSGLTVVGDDAQAIYGFRGSDHAHLRALIRDLPDVAVVRLERNFRSHQRLLDLANVVRPEPAGSAHRIRLHSDRADGRPARVLRCHDAPAEARTIVDTVLADHQAGRRLRDQAVLMRAAAHSDLLEVELTARGVPFVKYGGLKFLEAAHVKDFVASVRLLDNPLDEIAWYRLLRLHDGIGPARARSLLAVLADPARPVDDDRHAEAVAAAPAISRVALAASLNLLAAARDARRIGERARGCLELLRPLIDRPLPGLVRPAGRPGAVGRCGRPVTGSGRVRRRTHARPARVHQRSGRSTEPGRRLPGALDRPLGEGAGMARGARAAPGRRIVPVGHGPGQGRRPRGGGPAVLCRSHPRGRRVAPLRPAADAAPPACPRRPALDGADQPLPRRRRPGRPSRWST